MIDRVTIRMYKVGFGDCFLLTFWSGTSAKRVLVDCGSITEGKAQVSRVAGDVIANCGADGQPARIELVVATHRHRDHVGGFVDASWKDVEVGEVWMPWTEHPTDKEATQIRNRQSAFALALSGKTDDDDPLDATKRPPKSEAEAARRALRAMALNALTNEAAMATLHRGFAGAPPRHFLPAKDVDCEARRVAGLDGVTIHVLGPPRDAKAMASMDPPAGAAYVRAVAAGRLQTDAPEAFGFDDQFDRVDWRAYVPDTTFSVEDQRAVDAMAAQPEGMLAATLDRAVNNTSLILMFEVGDAWLLFPGDAQWGAWKAALDNPKARALLARTTVYKVGHHGSHNATPRELIESVVATKSLVALFSTKPVKQWPDIPRQPLVDDITARGGLIARSDAEADAAQLGFRVEPGLYIEQEIRLGGHAKRIVPSGAPAPKTYSVRAVPQSQRVKEPGPHAPPPRRGAPKALAAAVKKVKKWRVALSLLKLEAQLDALAPNRSRKSDGKIGDAAHATRASDHNPWVDDNGVGVVTAMDLTNDPTGGCDADKLAEAIRGARDVRVKYIIWNRRIANHAGIGSAAPWAWRPYSGKNKHTKHIHISVKAEQERYDAVDAWPMP